VNPPHDLTVEQAVLGAVLLSNVSLPKLIVDVGLTPDAFYRKQHAAIWEAMVALAMRGEPVDTLTLRGQLEASGVEKSTVEQVDLLPGVVPSAAAVLSYARRVLELAEWRIVMTASLELGHAVGSQDREQRSAAEAMLTVPRRRSDTRTPEALGEDVYRHLEGQVVPAWRTPWPRLNEALGGGLRSGEVTLLGGWTSHGKALDVDTPIPTPDGWRTMLDLQPGDHVFDETGRSVRVRGVTEVQLGRPCMEVEFSGGACLVADDEHEWLTWTEAAHRSHAAAGSRPVASSPWSQRHRRVLPAVRSTGEIASTLRLHSRGERLNHSVPVCGPLDYQAQSLIVDPYVLGAWLGDGNTSSAAITTPDREVLEHIAAAGHEIRPHKNALHFGIGSLTEHLRSLGVLGDKHIPEVYLRASVDQRMALIQGLMDSDGSATEAGQCEFSTTSPRIAAGVHEILAGLGICARHVTGRATLYGKDCGEHHRFLFTTTLPVFRLARKRGRLRQQVRREYFRSIQSVHRVESRPVKCIEVDSPNGLYLAGRDCVVTHNSLVTDQILRWCSDRGARVHLYINEMSPTMRAIRNVSAMTEVPQATLAQPKKLTDAERQKAVGVLSKLPFGITQVTDWSAEDIARDIRFRGWDVCALDLVHRLPYHDERELAQISTALNGAAQTSGAHLLAVVHLNEGRATSAVLPSPVLRDIRGSGMLKNDADNALFIHREEEEAGGIVTKTNDGVLYLAKCRNGYLENVPVELDPRRSRFLEPLRVGA
jgi:replicative DNA helicase